MRKRRVFIVAFSVLCIFLWQETSVRAEEDWSITLYGAILSADSLFETLFLSADLDDSYYFLALALSRKIGSFKKYMNFELEGQMVKHLGEQHHMEFNVLPVARWLDFPWNHYVETSFAVGTGLSFATEIPEFEARHHHHTSRLLGYVLFEWDFSLPRFSRWHLVARVHHRSGAHGLFNNVHDASNALGIGIKYDF